MRWRIKQLLEVDEVCPMALPGMSGTMSPTN